MHIFKSTLILLAAGLSGCASVPAPVVTNDVMGSRILAMGSRIEESLGQLTTLQRARMQGVEMKDPTEGLPADHFLMRRVTLEWQGDLRVVVRKLADLSGLDMIVIGTAPIPLHVMVHAVNQPLVKVLESIGVQAGSAADLEFHQEKNLLEIHYN